MYVSVRPVWNFVIFSFFLVFKEASVNSLNLKLSWKTILIGLRTWTLVAPENRNLQYQSPKSVERHGKVRISTHSISSTAQRLTFGSLKKRVFPSLRLVNSLAVSPFLPDSAKALGTALAELSSPGCWQFLTSISDSSSLTT